MTSKPSKNKPAIKKAERTTHSSSLFSNFFNDPDFGR